MPGDNSRALTVCTMFVRNTLHLQCGRGLPILFEDSVEGRMARRNVFCRFLKIADVDCFLWLAILSAYALVYVKDKLF